LEKRTKEAACLLNGISNLISTIKNDKDLRAVIGIYGGFFVNIAYAVYLFISNAVLSSGWLGIFGGYLVVLTLIRLYLFLRERKTRKIKTSERFVQGLKTYRTCGIVLVLTALFFMGMFVFIMKNGIDNISKRTVYPVAVFTFYKIVVSSINVRVYKIKNSPLFASAKFVNLSCALISLVILQSSLIRIFGGYAMNDFNHTATAVVGGVVIFAVFTLGVYMLIRASLKINKTLTSV
jgi:hypothetical protein